MIFTLCKTLPNSTRAPNFGISRRGCPVRQADAAEGRSWRRELSREWSAPESQALVTGGDSGIGRAAAIAFAREGADVAINYLPSEEKDAKEVIALIEAEGRKAIAIQGI
jgi:hypothetical protein